MMKSTMLSACAALLFLSYVLAPGPIQARQEDVLAAAIEAHGGLSAWHSFAALSYDLVQGTRRETHTIDLKSRKTRQESASYTIGFDGQDVWVTPGLEAFPGNPRFYNGLYFYFFAMPFVFADPGVNAEYAGRRTVDGTAYDVVKITYGEDVGDSPNDTYLAHLEPSTHRLRFLLYTVTYNSRAPSDNFNAMVYEDWQEVNGLLVPRRIVSFRWNKDQEAFGEQRGDSQFEHVSFFRQTPDINTFARPPGAEVAPLPERQ